MIDGCCFERSHSKNEVSIKQFPYLKIQTELAEEQEKEDIEKLFDNTTKKAKIINEFDRSSRLPGSGLTNSAIDRLKIEF